MFRCFGCFFLLGCLRFVVCLFFFVFCSWDLLDVDDVTVISFFFWGGVQVSIAVEGCWVPIKEAELQKSSNLVDSFF